MAFIQSIQLKTKNLDEIRRLNAEFRAQTEGKRTAQRSTICKDRDNADTYYVIVEFPSYDDAMKNSKLPETNEFAKRVNDLCDSVTFYNLDVVDRIELG